MDLHPSEHILFSGHPSWRATLGFYIKGLVLTLVVAVIVWFATSDGIGIGVAVGLLVLVALVGFLKRMSTHYVVTNERLHIRRGILSRATQETRLARVQNVNTSQSLLERLLRVGTVDFDTAGTDDADFTFAGIADPTRVVAEVDRAQREASQPVDVPRDVPAGPRTTGPEDPGRGEGL